MPGLAAPEDVAALPCAPSESRMRVRLLGLLVVAGEKLKEVVEVGLVLRDDAAGRGHVGPVERG